MSTLALGQDRAWSRKEAFSYCERLARTHYENFTVGSLLIPRDQLRHVYAVYGFCRTVDDLGDEAEGDRLALLDRWEEELRRAYSGAPRHPVMVALQETVQAFDIPQEPFLKLIEANRIDQRRSRYPAYQDVLHYCDHSANPVGRLFLYLFGYRDEERQRLSDCTCTALQLANFWQDVRRDYEKGRIYIPLEDMQRFGYTESELAANAYNERFARLMQFEVDRAEELFNQGRPLARMLSGIVRVDVALFTRGGMEVLRAIRRQRYDVLSRRPHLSRARKAWLFVSTYVRAKLAGGP